VLLYQTFMDGNERFGKPSRPEFLLRDGELLELVRGTLLGDCLRGPLISDPMAWCSGSRATVALCVKIRTRDGAHDSAAR
jgi:hypothetical protein